jgi:hypothetical protein
MNELDNICNPTPAENYLLDAITFKTVSHLMLTGSSASVKEKFWKAERCQK